MAAKNCKESVFSVREIVTDKDGRNFFPVTIICEGLGNLKDKNYYTDAAIKSGASVYEGKQAYYDHPSPSEENEQPNRTINKLLGHYEDVKAIQNGEGLWELQGKLVPIAGGSRADAIEALEHAVKYKTRYPDKDFVGISINGDGEGETLEYDEFIKKYAPPPKALAKLKEIVGQELNAITKLSDAFSADVVTAPGAGGKINTKEEKQRRLRMKFTEGLLKFFSAVESDNKDLQEAAVKDMLQAEGGEGETEKKEGEAEGADSIAKKMLQAMKQCKQTEGESEQEYEAKMMSAIKKEMEGLFGKKEGEKKDEAEGEAEKKEAAKKDDGDADDKEDEKKSEKKEADAGADDSKDADHPDKKQDIALLKKMMKKHAELEAKIEAMSKQMESAEAANTKLREDHAKVQTELKIKNKESMIDAKLSKCNLPRSITNSWRPVFEACKSEKEMDDKVTMIKETAAKVNAERFYEMGSIGLTEKASTSGTEKNDDLFI